MNISEDTSGVNFISLNTEEDNLWKLTPPVRKLIGPSGTSDMDSIITSKVTKDILIDTIAGKPL